MNNFAWYKALNFWCNEKIPFGSGLTIPFLIGVEKKFGRGNDFKIHTLLEEFSVTQDNLSISIRFCDYIGMDVCSLDLLSNEEKQNYTSYGSLILMVNDYDDIIRFQDFKKIVEDEYSTYIENHQFSLNDGEWSDFSGIDLNWLSKLF